MPATMSMLAYIGPGGVLGAIGAFLALLAAVVIALFGFVWYPVKRLMRARQQRREAGVEGKDRESSQRASS